jgi:hypothetical protein
VPDLVDNRIKNAKAGVLLENRALRIAVLGYVMPLRLVDVWQCFQGICFFLPQVRRPNLIKKNGTMDIEGNVGLRHRKGTFPCLACILSPTGGISRFHMLLLHRLIVTCNR